MRPTRLRRRLIDLVDSKVGYSWSGRSAYPVAIASGKGGTGKSILATNLSLALTKRDRRVLLVDADFGLGNVHLLFGVNPCANVFDLLKRRKTIREVVHDYHGVKFIPGGSGIAELASLTEPQLLFLGNQLGLLEDDADIIIFDTSSGLNQHTLFILSACREVIVITTPDITAITDAYALIKALFHRNHNTSLRVGLVVNRAKSVSQARAIFDNVARVTTRFLRKEIVYYGHIVDDEHITIASAKRSPVVASYPMSPSSRCLLEMAGRVDWQSNGNVNFSRRLKEILNNSVRL